MYTGTFLWATVYICGCVTHSRGAEDCQESMPQTSPHCHHLHCYDDDDDDDDQMAQKTYQHNYHTYFITTSHLPI